jgi:endonuclease/exonuclease/phosphatase family metal-dependent hydrolase
MFHGDADAETAAGLIELRKRIAACNIPPSKLDETLNIATWNIREFGRKRRKKKSLHYIAEIVGQFDLVGLVEVREDVSDLAEVMRILGPYWRVVFSDFIEDFGGNFERVAYVYDSRVAKFTGMAGNANEDRVSKSGEYLPEISWWRKPFMASFRAGSFDFILLTTHIRWEGSVSGRVDELDMLGRYVKSRAEHEFAIDKDIIVMGDFNIPSLRSKLYKIVTQYGLQMPGALAGLHGSNLAKNKRYDQILHLSASSRSMTLRGGVLDFFDKSWKPLYPEAATAKDKKFVNQLSDHLPLWLQLKTDISDMVLEQKLSHD